jgi:dTDP-4-amino-4,6-dideoxygalactose transaminase
MTTAFLDVRAGYLELRTEIDLAVRRVLESGRYVLGAEVESFEGEFAEFCGARHCVGVANGLDALYLGLSALGIGPGDEVVVPANTYIATWLAVSRCGARPVPVEPEPGSFNLDPDRVEAALTRRTRAILPVHLYGRPAELDRILDIGRRHAIPVLEDAAQAHGAAYRGRRIGAHGAAVAWSFYPTKNLGAFGDAGAVTTNSAELADRIRLARNYGSRIRDLNEVQGHNSRLDPMQAAILRVKLRHLDAWNARRREIAALYLRSIDNPQVACPAVPDGAEHAWHLFVVRASDRDGLRRGLAADGIETLVHYPVPPHLQKAYEMLEHGRGAFPIAERMAGEVLSLPMGPHTTPQEAQRVIDCVNGARTLRGSEASAASRG